MGMESFNNPQENISAGEAKVLEYVARIQAGEQGVLEGLPPMFKKSVLDKLEAAAPNQEDPKLYSEFREKNGESNGGFFWYEYRNGKAKELKESGEFEWGKERLYFDVKEEDFKKLRDLMFRIAGEQKIALGFKYLDLKQTLPSNIDGQETRFVANFANTQDAQNFYRALRDSEEYKNLIPDRSVDYKGVRVDSLAEYAGGFREGRGALERIMQGSLVGDMWEYKSESGKTIRISPQEYEAFKMRFDDASAQYETTREIWESLGGGV